MLSRNKNIIIVGMTRLIVPFIQLFALYVVFHGHYSPGGGFQGGALFGASVILHRVALGEKPSWGIFPLRVGLPLGLVGVLIYTCVGLFGLTSAGHFLDYSTLPISVHGTVANLRAMGILLIEIGVALGVCGLLVSIMDQLAERENV